MRRPGSPATARRGCAQIPNLRVRFSATTAAITKTPYSEPSVGRAGVRRYWQAVPDGQRDVRFGFKVLAVDRDCVIAHWTAHFVRVASGAQVALDGIFVLEFASASECRTLREWWHRAETGPSK